MILEPALVGVGTEGSDQPEATRVRRLISSLRRSRMFVLLTGLV